MKANSSNKESILAISLLLLLLFLYSRNLIFIDVAVLFIVTCLLFDAVAIFFDKAWKKLTQILGMISSTIILSVIFYVIVFPLGLILKMTKKNPLVLNIGKKSSTFNNTNKLFI